MATASAAAVPSSTATAAVAAAAGAATLPPNAPAPAPVSAPAPVPAPQSASQTDDDPLISALVATVAAGQQTSSSLSPALTALFAQLRLDRQAARERERQAMEQLRLDREAARERHATLERQVLEANARLAQVLQQQNTATAVAVAAAAPAPAAAGAGLGVGAAAAATTDIRERAVLVGVRMEVGSNGPGDYGRSFVAPIGDGYGAFLRAVCGALGVPVTQYVLLRVALQPYSNPTSRQVLRPNSWLLQRQQLRDAIERPTVYVYVRGTFEPWLNGATGPEVLLYPPLTRRNLELHNLTLDADADADAEAADKKAASAATPRLSQKGGGAAVSASASPPPAVQGAVTVGSGVSVSVPVPARSPSNGVRSNSDSSTESTTASEKQQQKILRQQLLVRDGGTCVLRTGETREGLLEAAHVLAAKDKPRKLQAGSPVPTALVGRLGSDNVRPINLHDPDDARLVAAYSTTHDPPDPLTHILTQDITLPLPLPLVGSAYHVRNAVLVLKTLNAAWEHGELWIDHAGCVRAYPEATQREPRVVNALSRPLLRPPPRAAAAEAKTAAHTAILFPGTELFAYQRLAVRALRFTRRGLGTNPVRVRSTPAHERFYAADWHQLLRDVDADSKTEIPRATLQAFVSINPIEGVDGRCSRAKLQTAVIAHLRQRKLYQPTLWADLPHKPVAAAAAAAPTPTAVAPAAAAAAAATAVAAAPVRPASAVAARPPAPARVPASAPAPPLSPAHIWARAPPAVRSPAPASPARAAASPARAPSAPAARTARARPRANATARALVATALRHSDRLRKGAKK